MQNIEKARIRWLDVLKCIGILEIYVGHFGGSAGALYPFVFSHHVQLFFLCGGFVENLNQETSILKNGAKKFLSLMVPFYFFTLLSLLLTVINNNSGWTEIAPMLKGILAGGVRNHFFAWPTWFISCQFVISVLFSLIRKVKYRSLMLLIGIAVYWAAGTFIPNIPSWPYNIDSALTYLLIYIIGYLSFPWITKLLNGFEKNRKLILGTGGTAFAYTVLMFFGIDALQLVSQHSLYLFAVGIVRPLIILWFWILVAYGMQHIRPLYEVGKKTLFLCGNEHNVKLFLPPIFGLFGIELHWTTPLAVVLYCVFLLAIAYFLLAPWQERSIAVINRNLKRWRVFGGVKA